MRSTVDLHMNIELTKPTMSSSHNWPFIINLGNSIIGVALLAMPFCFQKCGIILSMLVLILCTWLTLISCQLLMKAGITSRRRSYEFLAYYTHGATGKFVSEVGMIGFQLGTLIAQIVVIGDLGPSIVTKVFGIENSPGLRTSLMILLCMTIGLPMALIKDIRAVSRVSTVCVAFYLCFVLYVLWLALPNLWTGGWYEKVHLWRPQGLFQCLPILSFSFGCQTQLFLLYDALPEPSLKAMSKVVNCAVNLCAVAYLMVGFCGYIAFYTHDIPGDVIGIFPNTFFTDLMKVCFVFSIVITFPVIVFPCRASIYTLLYAKKSKARDEVIDLDTYIPAKQLKIITVSLVVGSMIIGILIPNVEFILSMNGAIMGTLICYIFPALFYLKVMGSKPESGRGLAQMVLFLGVTILLVSTYANLRSQDKGSIHVEELPPEAPKALDFIVNPVLDSVEKKLPAFNHEENVVKKINTDNEEDVIGDIRKEPPNPNPPDNREKLPQDVKPVEKKDLIDHGAKNAQDNAGSDKLAEANKAMELELQDKEKKQDELLAQLQKQSMEQKMLIEEQKQLLKEFKDHHEKDMKQEAKQQPLVLNQENAALQQPQQQADAQPQVNQQQQADAQPQVNQQQQADAQPQVNQQQQADAQPQVNKQQQADAQPQVNMQQQADAQPQVNMQQQADAQPQVNKQQQAGAQPQVNKQQQADAQPQVNKQQQANAQPQVNKQQQNNGPEELSLPQINIQDVPAQQPQLLQPQNNQTLLLDNINQQQHIQSKVQAKIVNQVPVVDQKPQAQLDTVVNQEVQPQHQQLVFPQQPQQQPKLVQPPEQHSNVGQDQNLGQNIPLDQQQNLGPEQQPAQFAPQQAQLETEQPLLPPQKIQLQQQEEFALNPKLKQEQQISQTEAIPVQENAQQKQQNVENLNRNKRDIDYKIVNQTVSRTQGNEHGSFGKVTSASTLVDSTSEVINKETKLLAESDEQPINTVKVSDKQTNLSEGVTNDTLKPKSNEEMRRKLKSIEPAVHKNRESVLDSSLRQGSVRAKG